MSSGELKPGTLLDDRFLLKRLLGTGSTGVVWLAEDSGGAQVALKTLHSNLKSDRAAIEQLAREAKLLATLVHPNIARPIHFQAEGAEVYFALEYVEGRPLDEEIGARAAALMFPDAAELAVLFEELCAGVSHAHSKFIVHRDLKPQNVLVLPPGPGPRIKVLDFGVAKLLEGSRFDVTTFGRQVGSLFYMSPEQTRGAPADVRSDVFALGTIFYELLTLRRAWAWDNDGVPLIAFNAPVPRNRANALSEVVARIQSGPRPHPLAVRPDLPPAFDLLLERAWAPDPAARHQSVGELLAEAQAAIARMGASAERVHLSFAHAPEVDETYVVPPEPRGGGDQRGTQVDTPRRDDRSTVIEQEPAPPVPMQRTEFGVDLGQPERPTEFSPVPRQATHEIGAARVDPHGFEGAGLEPETEAALDEASVVRGVPRAESVAVLTPIEPWERGAGTDPQAELTAPPPAALSPGDSSGGADDTRKIIAAELYRAPAPTPWSPWARRLVLASITAVTAAVVILVGLIVRG